MPIKFNPLTAQFDLTGSSGGASYIDGEVATYNDLSLSSTTAPLDSAWLVRAASGVWPFTKPGGIYIRTATGGTSRDADYTYAGIFPDVFSDAQFTLYDDADSTRNLKFQLSGISAGTTRTLTAPNASGRIQVEGQPIGNTTASTGAFTTLSATGALTAANANTFPATVSNANGIQWTSLGGVSNANGYIYAGYFGQAAIGLGVQVEGNVGTMQALAQFTNAGTTFNRNVTISTGSSPITASSPVFNTSQTWNNSAATFIGMNFAFSDAASATASDVLRIATGSGGTSLIVGIRKDGNATFANAVNVGTVGGTVGIAMQNTSVRVGSAGFFGITNTSGNAYGTTDVALYRDAAATLALRDLANPQAFRIYNTTDAGLTNYERGFMRWSSNVLQIGTEAAGTGINRPCAIVAGANTYTFYNNGEAVSSLSWVANNSGALRFDTRARIASPADSVLRLTNNAATDFDRLQFGGTTSSFPALKRSSTTLQVRLADDSAYSVLDAQLRAQGTAPATSGATGTAGDIRYDADYIYICTAASTWKRAAIATW